MKAPVKSPLDSLIALVKRAPKGSPVVGELSGFALGAPGVEARKVLDGTAGTR